MFDITIPGSKKLNLEHLVLDFNGTLACDGILIAGVAERLDLLSQQFKIAVITADTQGSAAAQLASLPLELIIIPQQQQHQAKLDHIKKLGQQRVVAIGNGFNDHLMLDQAALAIAVVQQEGAAAKTLQSADIIVPDIRAALDLLLKPKRLIATLRN